MTPAFIDTVSYIQALKTLYVKPELFQCLSELFKKSRKMNENFVTFRLIVFRFNATTIRYIPFIRMKAR